MEKPFSPFLLKAQLRNLLKRRENQQKEYASTPLPYLHATVDNKLDEEFMNKCTEIILSNIEDTEFSVNTLPQDLGMSRTSVFTPKRYHRYQSLTTSLKLPGLKELAK
ncbi:hypothetical protein [Bacteroides sp.]|uniref:hypothetical protein n=1 Tax=Bacteroides sp. TaxID=29523 RepID=UPI0026054661|nr:hypothetical protein [Bacteroides sp.]MDD3036924.1 hypothetical protein [Bacteroides sp.]